MSLAPERGRGRAEIPESAFMWVHRYRQGRGGKKWEETRGEGGGTSQSFHQRANWLRQNSEIFPPSPRGAPIGFGVGKRCHHAPDIAHLTPWEVRYALPGSLVRYVPCLPGHRKARRSLPAGLSICHSKRGYNHCLRRTLLIAGSHQTTSLICHPECRYLEAEC